MADEQRLKAAFQRVREDMEGVKDELAFALKRIARIEASINQKVISDIVGNASRQRAQRRRSRA